MAVCGERYKYLAVTASGYTFDNPYGIYVSPFTTDYQEWRSVATKINGLVNEHLAILQAIETAKNPATKKWLALSAERTKLLRHYEDLPAIFGFSTPTEQVEAALAVVSEGLCVLEQIDEAIESYGEPAPEVPGVTPKPKERPELPKLPPPPEVPWWVWAIGGAATVAVVTGLFYRVRGPQGQRR